jgi:hypothetical protein
MMEDEMGRALLEELVNAYKTFVGIPEFKILL